VIRHFKALKQTVQRFTPREFESACSSNRMPRKFKRRANGSGRCRVAHGCFQPASALQLDEVDRLEAAARLANERGLLVNAGHGINYTNVRLLIANPLWNEFNIGHSIVSRAVSIGLENAVRQMLEQLKS